MLTNEKVLEAFGDYLSQDPDYEVVMTSRGHTVMGWDNKAEVWRDVQYCGTPQALRDALLDAFENYMEYITTLGRRDLTEQ